MLVDVWGRGCPHACGCVGEGVSTCLWMCGGGGVHMLVDVWGRGCPHGVSLWMCGGGGVNGIKEIREDSAFIHGLNFAELHCGMMSAVEPINADILFWEEVS